MKRYLTSLIGLLSLCMVSTAYSITFQAQLTGGGVMPRLVNDTEVWIYPDLLNRYITTRETNIGSMWGGKLAVGGFVLLPYPIDFSLGVAGYNLNFEHIRGVKQPFVNQGNFDSSFYQYDNRSVVGFVEGTMMYTPVEWKPYFLVGLGGARNRASHYTELPLGNAVADQNFTPARESHFAYELGGGLQRDLFQDQYGIRIAASIDYRYLNVGGSRMGLFHGQPFNGGTLHVNQLQTDALLFTLSATV